MPFSKKTNRLNEKESPQSNTKEDSESRDIPFHRSGMTLKMNKMSSAAPVGAAKKARQNFYTKFLEKSDVIEIAIDLLDHEDVFELIHVLYDDLTEPVPSNYRLFKLLIKTEHMSLFELCLKK